MKQETRRQSAGKVGPLIAAALLLGATGCAQTLSGARRDAAANTQKVGTAADQAVADAKTGVRKAGTAVEAVPQNAKALVVTPEVKTAILRDPVLDDPRNAIDVSSSGHTVRLTEHVSGESLKTRATEDAEAALSKRHPDFSVVNALTVTPGNP